MYMKRSISDIENEIINQILVAETCFLICKSSPTPAGRGDDFLPFFYNLTFSKGVMSLHNLLLSKKRNEITIANYIAQKDLEFMRGSGLVINKKIIDLIKQMNLVFPISLRNKVIAHNDSNFAHADFARAYLADKTTLNEYMAITEDLKEVFCEVSNYDKTVSYDKILFQAKQVVETILKSN